MPDGQRTSTEKSMPFDRRDFLKLGGRAALARGLPRDVRTAGMANTLREES
jgi:hypothetical protein